MGYYSDMTIVMLNTLIYSKIEHNLIIQTTNRVLIGVLIRVELESVLLRQLDQYRPGVDDFYF